MVRRDPRGNIVIVVLLFVALVLFGSGIGIVAGAIKTAPKLEDVRFDPKEATILYDTNGDVIGRLYTENRVPVSLDDIPKSMQNAVIASEDDQFYDHHGVRPLAMLRALIADVLAGGKVQGGSTITQQLARTAFLSQEKTITRKINEAIWAIQIERKYSKDEILETYLNEVHFGHGTYGVEAAAQLYFGKHASQLTLPESAMLAGILPGPGLFSPYVDKDAAKLHRDIVLDRMEKLGYITPGEASAAKATPIKTVGLKLSKTKAPYFVEYVTQYLLDHYGESEVYSGGLRVYTTLDLKAQSAAENALLNNLPTGKVDKNGLHQPQGALLAMDPRNGYIRAMVGGRGEDKYNRALQAYRQPGSAFKPFVYTAAIDRGLTPATLIDDSPVQYTTADGQVWQPQNNDKKYRGPVPLRYALENSINTVAVKVLEQVGVDTAMDYAKRMGITSLVNSGPVNDRNLSLALGGISKGVTLEEMVEAYGVLANQGIKVQPIAVVKVEDKNGRILEENQAAKEIVLSEQTSYVVTDMMRGVIERGTGTGANIGRPAAGKTGTTSEYTNAWFVGFTPDLVAAVWIGNDAQKDPLVVNGTTIGSAKSTSIWGAFMRDALKNTPISDFTQPAGVVRRIIDADDGQLATDRCPNVRTEVYIAGTEPTEVCSTHDGRPLPQPADTALEGVDGQGGVDSDSGVTGGAPDDSVPPSTTDLRTGPPLTATT